MIDGYPIVGLKKNKKDFESELEKLGSIREIQQKESEASARISGFEKKIQYAEIEKVTWKQRKGKSDYTILLMGDFLDLYLFVSFSEA